MIKEPSKRVVLGDARDAIKMYVVTILALFS